MKDRKSLEERFWEKVDRSDGPEACWPWVASLTSNGYGYFNHSQPKRFGQTTKAHRIAFILTKGSLFHGMNVLHICDNPPCCNPSHLFSGTQKDNYRDMVAKGRDNVPRGDRTGPRKHPEKYGRGESHPMAKLTFGQVMQIREDYTAQRTSQRKLANAYKVNQAKYGESFTTKLGE